MNPLPDKQALGETAYWVFVSFLYAFIAADIAGRFSDLSLKWSKYEQKSGYPREKRKWWYVPVYSHLVVRNDVAIVGELLVADSTYPTLLQNLPVHQFRIFSRGSEFSEPAQMMRILHALNPESDEPELGKGLQATARS